MPSTVIPVRPPVCSAASSAAALANMPIDSAFAAVEAVLLDEKVTSAVMSTDAAVMLSVTAEMGAPTEPAITTMMVFFIASS